MSDRILEVSAQAFDEMKDRLQQSSFGDLDFSTSTNDNGELLTLHGLSIQSVMRFDNVEVKRLKWEIKRLREPLHMTPDVVRHAIAAVSDEKGTFNVEDVCDLAIKIMEIKQRNHGEN